MIDAAQSCFGGLSAGERLEDGVHVRRQTPCRKKDIGFLLFHRFSFVIVCSFFLAGRRGMH